jgi:hypothetical protein
LEQVSSHSLKATTLSWLAKAGSDSYHRTILGHHSSQKAPSKFTQGISSQLHCGP